MKERLRKAKQEIAGRDERIGDLGQYPRSTLSPSARAVLEGHIQEIYNDLLQVLEPRKTQEPSREEQRKRAQHWAKDRKHKK